VLPSFVLVWPSNCGSRSLTETIPKSLSDVFTREVLVLLLEDALAPGVVVDRAGERVLEALEVGAALVRVDVVREREHRVRVAGVPLQRDLDGSLGPSASK
jgi:hypothetical protein